MDGNIGKRLAQELTQRAEAQSKHQAEAAAKLNQEKEADEVALASLVTRVREEAGSFNQHAQALPQLTLTHTEDAGPYTLTGSREVLFSLQAKRLSITLPPSGSPLISTMRREGTAYIYHHIGPNGMATNRESTEDQVVDGLLRQACGL